MNTIEQGREDGDHRPVALAYGSAKFAPGGKGELSVPTTRIFRECSYRFRIALIDEFRTTQADSRTGIHLQKVATLTGKREDEFCGVKVVRGLLWCGSTSKSGRFVNRDLNAAINIRRCALASGRPDCLNRKCNPTKLPPQKLGKIILDRGAGSGQRTKACPQAKAPYEGVVWLTQTTAGAIHNDGCCISPGP